MLLETITILLMYSTLKFTFHEFVPMKLNNAKCSKKRNMKRDTGIANMDLFSDENEYSGKSCAIFLQLKASLVPRPNLKGLHCLVSCLVHLSADVANGGSARTTLPPPPATKIDCGILQRKGGLR